MPVEGTPQLFPLQSLTGQQVLDAVVRSPEAAAHYDALIAHMPLDALERFTAFKTRRAATDRAVLAMRGVEPYFVPASVALNLATAWHMDGKLMTLAVMRGTWPLLAVCAALEIARPFDRQTVPPCWALGMFVGLLAAQHTHAQLAGDGELPAAAVYLLAYAPLATAVILNVGGRLAPRAVRRYAVGRACVDPVKTAAPRDRLAGLPALDNAVHEAITGADLEALEALGKLGVPMALRDGHGEAPLSRALAAGNPELVRILLTYGALPEAQHLSGALHRQDYGTALQLMAAPSSYHNEAMAAAVTPLSILQAVQHEEGDEWPADVLGALLDVAPPAHTTAQINAFIPGHAGNIMHLAVSRSWHTSLWELFEHGGSLDTPDANGTAVSRWLSARQLRDLRDQTPLKGKLPTELWLQVLAYLGPKDRSCVAAANTYFTELVARISQPAQNEQGLPPRFVKRLVQLAPLLTHWGQPMLSGRTPVTLSPRYTESLPRDRKLNRTLDTMASLYLAARVHREVERWPVERLSPQDGALDRLLDLGAPPAQMDGFGRTPLARAVGRRAFGAVGLLLRYGANVEPDVMRMALKQRQFWTLRAMFNIPQPQQLERLLESLTPEEFVMLVTDQCSWPPLSYEDLTAEDTESCVVRILNLVDEARARELINSLGASQGRSAMHEAAARNAPAVFRFLRERGGDVLVPDAGGVTARDLAAHNDVLEFAS